MQGHTATPEMRMEVITGWLNAYRQGWVAYDREHALQLQEELHALSKAGSAA